MSNKQIKDCKSKHRWYDVIVAWASGEKIQFKFARGGAGWEDYIPAFKEDCPEWNDLDFEWRIKPETRIKRYRMALVHDYGVVSVDITNSSLDDPIEYNIQGFIRWVGDTVEVEIEV